MSVGRNDNCPCGSGKKYKKCCEQSASQQKMPRGLLALIGVIVALGGVGFIPALLETDDAAAPRRLAAGSTPVRRAASPVQAAAAAAAPVSPSAVAAPAAASQGQPPYPGGVWSAQHGHWHRPGATPEPAPVKNPISVQVERGAPQAVEMNAAQGGPGQVWSKEHGHWHKAAPTSPIMSGGGATALERATAAVATPMQPTIDNPVGLRVGGKPVSLQPQPGEAQPGKVWSAEHGHWHDAPGAAASTSGN